MFVHVCVQEPLYVHKDPVLDALPHKMSMLSICVTYASCISEIQLVLL